MRPVLERISLFFPCLFLFLLLVLTAATSAHDTHCESLVYTAIPLSPTESNKLGSERPTPLLPCAILTRDIGKEININHSQEAKREKYRVALLPGTLLSTVLHGMKLLYMDEQMNHPVFLDSLDFLALFKNIHEYALLKMRALLLR